MEFSTPDTFAKYLYHKNKNEVNRLKATLIGFFIIEQYFFGKRDKRPTVFITSLTDEKGSFPPNVGILSWNYDYQMQYALNKFQQEELISQGGINIKRPSYTDYFPGLGPEQLHETLYNIVHLNGIAGFYLDETHQINSNLDLELNQPRDFSPIIKQIYIKAFKGDMLFTFAWEAWANNAADNITQQRMKHALKIAENTTILVIIGYSFPFFNRKVDNEIFNKFLESGKLKKIYFQDPYKEGKFLKSQFNIPQYMNGVVSPIPIEHIPNASNYYIPYEL